MRLITLVFAGLLALATASSEKKVVCYFGSWGVYRQGNGKFDISYIDPNLCTHLIYAFVGIGQDGSVRVLDAWQDLPDNWGKDGYGRFNKLREINPKVKTMIAIGGWNEGSVSYSGVMNNPSTRNTFVENVVAFVKKYGFDGFDIDWEYPSQRGGAQADKQNYVSLVKELRQRFDQEGLILSAAVGAVESSASQSYIISEVSKYLHFINLMTYDLHGSWDGITGINAPLYAGSWEYGSQTTLNVNASVHYWLNQGAPAEKLVVGVPFYGKSFTLSNSRQNGIGAAAGIGSAGPYTSTEGMLGYNEICEKITTDNWQVEFQDEQKVPYAFKGDQWVGYDDPRSLKEKAAFVNSLGLGGMMVWSIETDDFNGICGPKYPLLNAINEGLGSGVTTSSSNSAATTNSESELQNSNQNVDVSGGESNESEGYQEPSVPESQPQQPQVTSKPQVNSTPNQLCTKEGYVRDPVDCSVYYYCQEIPPTGRFNPLELHCPASLAYDVVGGYCNYNQYVDC